MSNSKQRHLAIIPAFNESQSVGNVVRQIHEEMPECDVVVIDDGSVDGTPRFVPEGARVIILPFNLGIGGAMQTGYRYAALNGYDVAVQVDADGQHPPTQVKKLIDELEKSDADMVIGSRFKKTIEYRQTLSRMVGIHWLRHFTKLLTGLWITDPTSGFRAVNKNVISAFAHWYPDDYPEPEVIVLLHRAGFNITEIQVEMNQRETGETSIPFARGLFYVIKVSASLVLDLIREPWPPAVIKHEESS